MNQYAKIHKKNKNNFEARVVKFSLPLLTVFTFLYLFYRNVTHFKIFVDLYSVIVGGSLMILLFLMSIERHDKFIRYLSWGYIFICVLLFIKIEVDLDSYLKEYNLDYLISILSTNLFEIIIIKISIICYRKKLTATSTMTLFSSIYFFIAILYRVVIDVIKIQNYLYLHILLCTITSIIVVSSLLKFEKKYKKSDWLPLVIYVLLQEVHNILLYLNIVSAWSSYIFIGYFLRFLAFLCIFWLMEKRILSLSYEGEAESIKKRQDRRKKLNSSLKKQERILEELEIQTRRNVKRNKEIIDKIPELIIIFKYNNLEYMNKYAEEYLIGKLNLDCKKITLDFLLKNLIDSEELRLAIYYGIEKCIIVNDKNGEELQFEASLVNLNENNKVLIMKSNKDQLESLKVMEKYNYILREEEIMEEFYANISHELRTPINVIYSALQLNSIAIDNKDEYTINRGYNIIKQNCKRLIRTINNFIDSNKISDGYLEGNKKVFNIVYLIDEIVDASKKYMQMKNNVIIFDPQEEQVFINGSIEHTIKVILNILSNALKYGKENSEVFIVTYVLNETFYLEIVYKGEPIPKKKLSYVFRKFTKLDDYLNRTSEGSGLGLFLAKKLVEQNGGTIDIFSDKIGNVATITLPIVNESSDSVSLDKNNLNDIMELVDIEFSDIYF